MRVGKPVKATLVTSVIICLTAPSARAAIEVPPDYEVLAPIQAITAVNRDRLDNRVADAWDAPALGDTKGMAVDSFASDPTPEVDYAADKVLMPASTTKLLTAAAVLKALGPEARFTTSVTRQGRQVFLVGGGDPQLTSFPTAQTVNANASLLRLAKQTARVLTAAGVTQVRLRYDDTLFSPPTQQPFWGPDYLQIGVVAPITALMADGGRLNPPASPRSPNPSLTATQRFATFLEQEGLTVNGDVIAKTAEGTEVASVESPPLADLVEHMLLVSDNTEAEVLAHHAGLELLGEPTFEGGAAATLQELDGLGVDTDGLVLNDGSGLSRRNRISPQQLLLVLRAAIQTDPDALWPIYTGLPVAGFDGSLAGRFNQPDAAWARGAVSGKTGTLTGTSTLAGLAVDRDGQLFTYAVMTNRVNVWAASRGIDAVLGRIAGCRCAGTQLQSAE